MNVLKLQLIEEILGEEEGSAVRSCTPHGNKHVVVDRVIFCVDGEWVWFRWWEMTIVL